MRYLLPILFVSLICCGLLTSCKHSPTAPTQKDTVADTTKKDTTKKPPPDTTKTVDTTSHNFAWTSTSIPSEPSLSACWVFGPNDIYVAGRSIWKTTDGVTWKDVSPTDSRGNSYSGAFTNPAMFAFSENIYWLVNGGLIFNVLSGVATGYSFGSSTGGPYYAIWGLNNSDMFAVGDYGSISHFDGTSWTLMTSGTTKQLRSIWGTDDNNIWACGLNPDNGATVLLHYDGTSWTEDPISVAAAAGKSGNYFSGVWAVDSAIHKFGYAVGRILLWSYGGLAWNADTASIPSDLWQIEPMLGVRGQAANDFMIFGGGGFLSHWNGSSWYPYTFFYQGATYYVGLGDLSMLGNTVCAVGVENNSSWVLLGQR